MTENKRFTREEDSDYIRDNQTDKRVLYVSDIVDDLNELNDENTELKQLIKQLLKTTPIPHNLAIQLKNHVRELL